MADSLFQRLTIGGSPDQTAIARLRKALEDIGFNEIEEMGDSLCLHDGELASHALNSLCQLLQELQLPYDHFSEAKWDYESDLTAWRPGMESPMSLYATQGEEPLITLASLQEALAANQTLEQFLKPFVIPALPEWKPAERLIIDCE